MTGTVVVHKTQVGQSGTAANNFTIRTLDDGSLRVSRGNAGAEIYDVLVIDANGNFSTAPVIGVGQTWQDVTGSRSSGVNYTNTTGRPIQVTIYTSLSASAYVLLIVDGLEADYQSNPSSASASTLSVSAVIPNGAVYRFERSGTANPIFWRELR